jgi:hypothetical protein
MEKIIIKETKNSPKVIMDNENGILQIIGDSYPENAKEFYKQIFDWIESFFENKEKLFVNFNLSYFNSSSLKYIIELLILFNKYHLASKEINVIWEYDSEDIEMKETAEELSSELKFSFDVRAI